MRILLLLAAIVFSLVLPWLWQGSYDARIENKLKKFSANVTTYQMQYKSFTQKMEMMSACEAYGIELETLAVEDYAEVMSAQQLAKIVREQLQELEECIEFYDFPVEKITAETMQKRVKYVMYTLTDKINISGIDYWEVTYQTDDFEISLKLDSEFFKIYGLQVNAGSIYKEDWKLWDYYLVDDVYAELPSAKNTWAYQVSDLYNVMMSGLVSYWELNDAAYGYVDLKDDADDADALDEMFIGIIEFYENVDWEALTGQTDGEEEDAGSDANADIDEAYTDKYEDKYGNQTYGDDKEAVFGSMHVQMKLYKDMGFCLDIQK